MRSKDIAKSSRAIFDVDALADLVADKVAQRWSTPPASGDAAKLLDRAGLSRALAVSVPTVDKLRRRPGFPTLWIMDAPRFDLGEVLTWLKAESAAD
jgi:hypothetical protein